MGATVGTTGTMGATEDTMAATAITPGGDAVAMVVMAATDTTAARHQQWRWQQRKNDGPETKSNSLQLKIRSL